MSPLTQMKLCLALTLFVLIKHAGAECHLTFNGTKLCEMCNGTCLSENGCNCDDEITPCLPKGNISCNAFDATTCCPTGSYYNRTDSCCTEIPTCANPCSPEEICQEGICVCNSSKQQNKTISDINPQLVCDTNAITVTLSKCLLYTLGFDPDSLHVRDNSINCSYVYNDVINNQSIVGIQGRAESSWCGNTLSEDESYIYVNNIIYIGVRNKSIITVNPISFDYSCRYIRNFQANLILGNITSQTVKLPGINETGQYPTTMIAYKDRAMTQQYASDDEIVIGTDIFVGLKVEYVEGKNYALRILNCTASPTQIIDSNSVTFISQGCVANTDISAEIIENGLTTESKFRINSFQFQYYSTVYLTCNVRLCVKSSSLCNLCGNVNARSYDDVTREIGINLKMQDFNFIYSSGKNTVASWALLAGIQFAMVFMKVF